MSFADVAEQQILEAQLDAAKQTGTAFFSSGDPEVDAALAAPLNPSSTNSAIITVYDTSTGEARPIPVSLLAKTLVKRRRDPKSDKMVPAFSRNPTKEYVRGEVMCYLHPDHPDYESLREVGLYGQVCGGGETVPAAHLASEFNREQHMEHRHSREWAVMKAWRDRKERDEDRRLAREQVAATNALVAGNRKGAA